MRKSIFHIAMLTVVIGLAGAVQAADPVPFVVAVTVPTNAGTGTFTYTNAVKKAYSTSLRVLAINTPSAVSKTNTIQFVDGSVTNTIGTKITAANSFVFSVTNDWPHFRSSDGTTKILISTGDTNGFTAYIYGYEE